MKLHYLIVLMFVNAQATQYCPARTPIVVKVGVKAEHIQNEQAPSRHPYAEQPQAMIMEKTEKHEETGLRNRKNKSNSEPKSQETSPVRPHRVTHSLGLLSLFSCVSQTGQ